MQSFSKEEILKLTESPSDFKNAIINSKGFIFYLSEKFNITFSKELLLDTINIYSIQYLTENRFEFTLNYGKKVYDFNTVMTSFINNESFKDNLKYNLAAMRTMELHDKLTPKDNSVKIKKNKI